MILASRVSSDGDLLRLCDWLLARNRRVLDVKMGLELCGSVAKGGCGLQLMRRWAWICVEPTSNGSDMFA